MNKSELRDTILKTTPFSVEDVDGFLDKLPEDLTEKQVDATTYIVGMCQRYGRGLTEFTHFVEKSVDEFKAANP